MSREKAVLFTGQKLRAICHWPNRRRLVVRFDHWVRDKRHFKQAAVWRRFQDSECSVLTVQTARNDWGLNDELPGLMHALRGFTQGFAHVAALGFSMGAYMALLLAPALHLRKVTLVSPQYSIQRRKVPFENRYWREAQDIVPVYDRFDADYAPKLHGALLYDPSIPKDKKHCALILREFVNITPVPLVFGGHPATKIIKAEGRWGRLVDVACAEENDPNGLRRVHKIARRHSAKYAEHLKGYQEHRRTARL